MTDKTPPTVNWNHYRCPECKTEWEDTYDCGVDDTCPECKHRHITPYKSIPLVPAAGGAG